MDNDPGDLLEPIIDRILVSARGLKDKLKAIKELDPDNGSTERADQTKNLHRIRELERENVELKQALEDHQYGLEFIMSKYRSQVVELTKLNKLDRIKSPPDTLQIRDNVNNTKSTDARNKQKDR